MYYGVRQYDTNWKISIWIQNSYSLMENTRRIARWRLVVRPHLGDQIFNI